MHWCSLLHTAWSSWTTSSEEELFCHRTVQPQRSLFLIKWEQLQLWLCFPAWGMGTSFCVPAWKGTSAWGWFVGCTLHGFLRAQLTRGRYAKRVSRCYVFMPIICAEMTCNQKCVAIICAAETQPAVQLEWHPETSVCSCPCTIFRWNRAEWHSRFLPRKRWASHCSSWRVIFINLRSNARCCAFVIRSHRGKLTAGWSEPATVSQYWILHFDYFPLLKVNWKGHQESGWTFWLFWNEGW